MTNYDLRFFEYLAQAQLEVLQIRERRIFELRYGLTGGNAATLADIGKVFGLSRERIRQLLCKCHRKIRSQGQRKIKDHDIDSPCAELLLYVRSIIRPQEVGSTERFIEFCRNLSSLPQETHAFQLTAELAYSDQDTRKKTLEEAKKALQEFENKQKKIRLQEKILSRLQELLSYVIYPKNINFLSQTEFKSFNREREVSLDGEGKAGSFYSRKLGRCVQYESSLEMDFLSCLESQDNIIFYQEQPVRIPYELDGNTYFYYPDVLFILKDGTGILTEVKPVFKMALQENWIKWSALKKYCNQNGLGLLITDGKYSIQQIQRHEVNPDFASVVLEKLQQGNMNWTEYKKIKDQFNPSRDDFVALVMKNKLVWTLTPFFLGLQP